MKVKYPHTPELYKRYKRIKNLNSIESWNDETGERTMKVSQWSYEYMKVLDKIDGKIFINNIPDYSQYRSSIKELPYLVNEQNEIIKFEPLKNEKGEVQIRPYADGFLVGLENIDDYIIGEYYYIMELEE